MPAPRPHDLHAAAQSKHNTAGEGQPHRTLPAAGDALITLPSLLFTSACPPTSHLGGTEALTTLFYMVKGGAR